VYSLDPIEINALRDIHELLVVLTENLEGGNPIYAHALLCDDDEYILTHICDAKIKISTIINRVHAHNRSGL
jgi:hypothetical protein